MNIIELIKQWIKPKHKQRKNRKKNDNRRRKRQFDPTDIPIFENETMEDEKNNENEPLEF